MKITIAIPNYNGEEILKKNLPNILDSGADEVIVLDDCSIDQSLQILEKFNIQSEKLKILKHKKNKGFILSVNELFDEASGDIVVLLNNDVWVEKDFLNQILNHFKNKKVFSVNLHEVGEGPAVAFWKDGFYQFKRGQELKTVQKSAWASGGSAAFRKDFWQSLGGFDKIFAPFYFEDIDLSFRALKEGYEILWEPNAKVRHHHGTTIKKSHSKKYTEWVQQRNQLLFIWKNIKDPRLLSEHKKNLVKRLFKLGYFVPFFWALTKKIASTQVPRNGERGDLEAINYAKNPKLSVITVTFNNEDSIKKYIASILEYLPKNGEIVILDNNSNDGTLKKLEEFGDRIKLIKSSENIGFSKGNNRAAKQALGDYLFFLNPDTEIEKSIFEELINFYENTVDVGIVGPRLIMENGQTQESVKKSPSIFGAIKEFVFGIRNAYSQYAPTGDNPMEVEVVYGAAMLMAREIFEKLRGFDERYFLYYEDADLCKRVRYFGKKIYYYPAVSIKHLVGASKSDQDRYKLNLESARKYHGILGAFILQLIFWVPRLRQKL